MTPRVRLRIALPIAKRRSRPVRSHAKRAAAGFLRRSMTGAPVRARCLALVAGAVLGAWAAAARADAFGVVIAPVTDTSQLEPLATFDAGRRQGVAPGDPVAIVEQDDPTTVVTTGEVCRVEEHHATARLPKRLPAISTATRPVATHAASGPAMSADAAPAVPAFQAVVVPAAFVTAAKAAMPAGTTVAATVAGVGPGHRQVWIALGRTSGLAEDDAVWIRRAGLPIARGRVIAVLDGVSMVQPRPLVADAVPEAGDLVELWPTPAMKRSGRPETVVVEATPDADGTTLTLAGARRDGLRPGRQLELFDGDAYVGVTGVVTSSDRLCLAKSLRAMCATQPAAGIRAVARPAASQRSDRLAARVFDVRPDYILISAGQADGVAAGQTFVVLRDGARVAHIEVRTVEVDFSGAQVVPDEDGRPAGEIRKWDLAVREPVPPDPSELVGAISRLSDGGAWVTGVVRAGASAPRLAEVLRVVGEPGAAAMTAGVSGTRVLLYVPPGWGRVSAVGQPLERTRD